MESNGNEPKPLLRDGWNRGPEESLLMLIATPCATKPKAKKKPDGEIGLGLATEVGKSMSSFWKSESHFSARIILALVLWR